MKKVLQITGSGRSAVRRERKTQWVNYREIKIYYTYVPSISNERSHRGIMMRNPERYPTQI